MLYRRLDKIPNGERQPIYYFKATNSTAELKYRYIEISTGKTDLSKPEICSDYLKVCLGQFRTL
jgi:hypothetical protein